MVFITRYCKNQIAEHSRWFARVCAFLLLALLAGLVALSSAPAHAETAANVAHMGVERDSSGVYVNASLEFSLPPLVESALEKGIPITFIVEADLVRERWYWLDRKVSAVQRYLRVSYQPLTQRWRLNVSSAPFDTSGLGVSVGQTYDQLSDVLATLQRVARWKVADGSELSPQQPYQMDFRFQLDISQLPRPLQIGALGRSDWSLAVARSERVPALHAP